LGPFSLRSYATQPSANNNVEETGAVLEPTQTLAAPIVSSDHTSLAFMRQARPDTTGILRRPRKRRRTTRSIATWHPRVITRGGDPPT
jgi:hypothetical protein